MKKSVSPKTDPEKKEQVSEIIIKTDTTLIWVDALDPAKRSDGLVLIRLVANLPEGLIEQAKIITTQDHLKNSINNICRILDYYPESPKADELIK